MKVFLFSVLVLPFLSWADDADGDIDRCVEPLVQFQSVLDGSLINFCRTGHNVDIVDHDTSPVLIEVEGTVENVILFDPLANSLNPLEFCSELEAMDGFETIHGECSYIPQDLIDAFIASRDNSSNNDAPSDLPPSVDDDNAVVDGGASFSIIKQSLTSVASAMDFQDQYCRPHLVHRHPIISCACSTDRNIPVDVVFPSNDVFLAVAVLTGAARVKVSSKINATYVVDEFEETVQAGQVHQYPITWGRYDDRRLEIQQDSGPLWYHFVAYTENEGVACPPQGCMKRCLY